LCDDINTDHLRFTDAEARMRKRVAGDHQRVSAPGRTKRGRDGRCRFLPDRRPGNDARPLHQAGRGTAAAAGTNVIAPSAPKGALANAYFLRIDSRSAECLHRMTRSRRSQSSSSRMAKGNIARFETGLISH
jgi:hypothetical protein